MPRKAVAHLVALLPETGDYLHSLIRALNYRIPGLDPVDPAVWGALPEPRPCTFGDFRAGQWRWHFLFDPAGMAEDVSDAVQAAPLSLQVFQEIDRHRACALVFLLEAPEGAGPMDCMRALCQAGWAWLDVGAHVLVWPEGRTAALGKTLIGVEPEDLQAEHSWMFVSNGVAQAGTDSTWFRTYGMGQFSLPDLLAEVPRGRMTEQELESLRLFLETLPPSMIREHGVLPPGGTVQVGSRVWTASRPPDPAEMPPMVSRFGFQYLA